MQSGDERAEEKKATIWQFIKLKKKQKKNNFLLASENFRAKE